MARPDGIILQHPTARSQICLVELRDRPYFLSVGAAGVADGKGGRPLIPAPILDCGCGVVHEFKTVHLLVDDQGRVMVSEGVLELVRSAGETGFDVVGHTPEPYAIEITKPRAMTDFDARAYRPLTPIKQGA